MQESTSSNPSVYTPVEFPLKRLLLNTIINSNRFFNWLENYDPQKNKQTNKTKQKAIKFKHENMTLTTYSESDEPHKLSPEQNVKQLLASFTHFIKEVFISHVGLSFHTLGKCLNLGKVHKNLVSYCELAQDQCDTCT